MFEKEILSLDFKSILFTKYESVIQVKLNLINFLCLYRLAKINPPKGEAENSKRECHVSLNF